MSLILYGLRNVSAYGQRDVPIVVDGVEEGTENGDDHGTGMCLFDVILGTD